jgi:TusA-related sulfurtransferase
VRGDELQVRERGVSAARVDLRAYACPITWVKTRIALDRLRAGDVLEVWLSAGEPAESVPRTAEEDGHRLVAAGPLAADGGGVRVLLEKRAQAPGGEPWP